MSNGNLEIRAISGHTGGTPGGGEYRQPDGSTHAGASRDYDVCKLIDTTTCIGCKACEVACVEWNGYEFRETTFDNTYQTMPETAWNFWNLIKFNEVETDGGMQWLMRKDQCMHCEEPGCLIACPADGAIVQYTNGIVDFNQANCIGCQYCVTGCPFNIPKFNEATKKVYKCTLCSDRVGAGLEPACIKSCPTGCLHFGSKEDMKFEAGKRVAQLRANGHADADVYDPSGVQGTHVIYVLGDAKHPENYGGLPADPRVPVFVKLWKGPLKWLGGIGLMAGVFGVFMHYVRFGPKEVDKVEEVKR
jgi:formate dehydrogenase beta subunit